MVGAIAALVVGLHVYAPTAPFAMVELGLPATIVGGVVGFLVGSILSTGRWISRHGLRAAESWPVRAIRHLRDRLGPRCAVRPHLIPSKWDGRGE